MKPKDMIKKMVKGMALLDEVNKALGDGVRPYLENEKLSINIIRGSHFKMLAGDNPVTLRPRGSDGRLFPNEAYFVVDGVEFSTLVLAGHEDLEDPNRV